jgi:hypothetical protein
MASLEALLSLIGAPMSHLLCSGISPAQVRARTLYLNLIRRISTSWTIVP